MSDNHPFAIQVENISKSYYPYSSPASLLWSQLLSNKTKTKDEVHALKDITFDVKKGEYIGIIGLNGAGKSSLLKIISGAAQATSGNVKTSGKIFSLLELGVGFNHELSGRENLYNAAALYEIPTSEISAKMHEMESFAEIGNAIDKPIKYYSSGMVIRLAFALFKTFAPEILIIDEALSVGDIYFQQKCFDLLRSWKKQGRTILFASHDMTAVQNFCDRVLLLHQGQIEFIGDSQKAVNLFYQKTLAMDQPTEDATLKKTTALPAETPQGFSSLLPAPHRQGKQEVEITNILAKQASQEPLCYLTGETLELEITLQAHQASQQYSLNIGVHDPQNFLIFGTSTFQQKRKIIPLSQGDSLTFQISLQLDIQPGDYTLTISIAEHHDNGQPLLAKNLDSHSGLGPLQIKSIHPKEAHPYFGTKLPCQFQEKKNS